MVGQERCPLKQLSIKPDSPANWPPVRRLFVSLGRIAMERGPAVAGYCHGQLWVLTVAMAVERMCFLCVFSVKEATSPGWISLITSWSCSAVVFLYVFVVIINDYRCIFWVLIERVWVRFRSGCVRISHFKKDKGLFLCRQAFKTTAFPMPSVFLRFYCFASIINCCDSCKRLGLKIWAASDTLD